MATTYNNLYLDLRTELRRAGDEEATQSARATFFSVFVQFFHWR